MKNWPQNLLILFSLGLCVLLVVQWQREEVLRQQIGRADSTSRTVSETVRLLQEDVERLQAEITRVEGLRQQLAANASTREVQAARLTEETRAQKVALDQANQNITKQNDALKKLAAERDDLAQRYNQLARDYNELVNRWNAQQAALTNAARVSQ